MWEWWRDMNIYAVINTHTNKHPPPTHTHKHTYTHTYKQTHTHTHTHTYIHPYTYIHSYLDLVLVRDRGFGSNALQLLRKSWLMSALYSQGWPFSVEYLFLSWSPSCSYPLMLRTQKGNLRRCLSFKHFCILFWEPITLRPFAALCRFF